MTKPRKFLITVLLLISTLIPAWATGMPVIDITAIANAIAEFSTTVQQYQKQVMQWKSEYDRLARAAESIAKGDFDSILSGISQAATAISGYSESLSGFAEIAAAAQTGRKLTYDAKRMSNSIESTWASFLHKMNSTDSAEDSIDVLWDVVALTPVSETFAASDFLTKDVLNDAYLKKLRNDEKAMLVERQAELMADAIKAKDEAAEILQAAEESTKQAEEAKNKSLKEWEEATKRVVDLQQKLQASAQEDGDTESNKTRVLRAAVQSAEALADTAYKSYQEMDAAFEKQQAARDVANSKYTKANENVTDTRTAMQNLIDTSNEEDRKKNAVAEELEKARKEYENIQKTRIAAYRKAYTYNEIPVSILEEAYASEEAFRWYISHNYSMEGFESESI